MKVHLIKKQTVVDYLKSRPMAATGFIIWMNLLRGANWNVPGDILLTFRNADILGKGSNRVVFNIGGNKHRLICSYYFGKKEIHFFIKWIGTHSEYDKLCKLGSQYNIDNY